MTDADRPHLLTLRRALLGGLAAAPFMAVAPDASAQQRRRRPRSQRTRSSEYAPTGIAEASGRARGPLVVTPEALAADAPPTWIGLKRVALLPVILLPRGDVVPPDWETQILRRMHDDPDASGADISLRAYIRAASHGRADIEGVVEPREEVNLPDVPVGHFGARKASLQARGFDAAAIVTLGGQGTGSAEAAGYWARFAMAEGVGLWAMEFLHVLTGYKDLYVHLDPPDRWFDVMACNCRTHPSTFTKRAWKWVDEHVIAQHGSRTATYDLNAIALTPPSGRHMAVRVGSGDPHLMIEARKLLGPFERTIPLQEGVIVYEVISSDEEPTAALTLPNIQLRTRTPLAPGQSYTSQSGVQIIVQSAISNGYTVNVVDTNLHLVDRSDLRPAGAPTGCAIPGVGDYIDFRTNDGQMVELERNARGAVETNLLSAHASVPRALGNPFVFAGRGIPLVLYRGDGGLVHSLYPTGQGGVGHDSLSAYAQAPAAADDPVGHYRTSANDYIIVYRGNDRHLHVLYAVGNQPVSYSGNLTGAAYLGAPPAMGVPAICSDPRNNIVVYRGENRHIMSAYWSQGPSGLDDLSGYAGAPLAIGDPVAYYTPHDDMHQIFYLGEDRHLWELFARGDEPVAGWDLTARSDASPAALIGAKPSAYYDASTNTKHVVYATSDGRVHEIWWTPGGSPQHVDMTARYGLPLAADRPTAYATENPSTQHVAYRGRDGHVYEVLW